LIVGPE